MSKQLPDEPGRTAAYENQKRIAELEHTILVHQDWFKLKDERIAELEQIIDTCEVANLNHLKHIKQLEQLCRDLHRGLVYALICADVPLEGNSTYQTMKQRMDALGLLKVSHE